jgi:hypothetical protein
VVDDNENSWCLDGALNILKVLERLLGSFIQSLFSQRLDKVEAILETAWLFDICSDTSQWLREQHRKYENDDLSCGKV